MSDQLAIKKIRKDLKSNEINKQAASKMLESLINESDDDEIRSEAIDVIEEFSIKSNRVFKLLEKALVSDESPLVRFSAAKSILHNFPNQEDSPILWAIENENSIYFFKLLIDLLGPKSDIEGKKINELRRKSYERIKNFYKLNYYDSKFILDLDFIDYQRFRKQFKDFLKKFKIREAYQKELIKENTEIGFKNLGRIKLSEEGYIKSLVLTDLYEIPESIFSLQKLESLTLHCCNLNNFPDLSSKIQNLKQLNLIDNEYDQLPDWIFMFSEKEENITHYVKQGVLSSEAALLKLFEILTGHEIMKTSNFFQATQRYGYYFSLDKEGFISGIFIKHPKGPKIGIIPKQICELHNLEELYFINQNIKEIPICIDQLKKLRILDLRNNNIEKIPESFQKLEILRI
jgi:Leucine-rich repeat (LRR) protein